MMESTTQGDLLLRTQAASLAGRAESRRAQLEALEARGPRPRRALRVPGWLAHPVRALHHPGRHRTAAA